MHCIYHFSIHIYNWWDAAICWCCPGLSQHRRSGRPLLRYAAEIDQTVECADRRSAHHHARQYAQNNPKPLITQPIVCAAGRHLNGSNRGGRVVGVKGGAAGAEHACVGIRTPRVASSRVNPKRCMYAAPRSAAAVASLGVQPLATVFRRSAWVTLKAREASIIPAVPRAPGSSAVAAPSGGSPRCGSADPAAARASSPPFR